MAEADRIKWDARWREEAGRTGPSPWLVSLDAVLPRAGRALDVAGGAGRNAVWLAQRGLSVTLVDVSPVGVAAAEASAQAAGVAIEARVLDLETEALPAGPWDLIVQVHYLQRSLFSHYAALLAPGGLLVVEHPTLTNATRHPRPGPAYLLEDGELPRLCAGLSIVQYDEGWNEAGRHEARLVARRDAGS
jgi:2-polyprenyl-3-methyl-5-hydroxy-6-metoxy-1,4-benzoquinol methylase